jgi:hypothetical protein
VWPPQGPGSSAKVLGSVCGFAATFLRLCPDDGLLGRLEDAVMFGSTYAVSWEGAGGRPCAGRLGMDGRGLSLTGASNGCHVEEAIPFREIDSVRIEAGRLQVRRRNGRSLSIASLDAPGALRELAERLAVHTAA